MKKLFTKEIRSSKSGLIMKIAGLLLVLLIIGGTSVFAQGVPCSGGAIGYEGGTTSSGITVTASFTGEVDEYGVDFLNCGYTVLANSVWLNNVYATDGSTITSTVTFTFSVPVNNVVVKFNATSRTATTIGESITFTTSAGTVTTSGTSCDLTKSGNTYSAIPFTGGAGGGGGEIMVSSTSNYSTLTITDFGEREDNGTILQLCAASINGCSAGTAQVSLTGSTLSNICPATTVNLDGLFTGTAPTGSSLVWFTNATHTGTAYATPSAAVAGTYYAFFYDSPGNCYNTASSTASVVVNITACCAAGTTAPSLSGTTISNVCSATTVNLNSLHSGTVPSGTSLVWFTSSTHTGTAYATPTAATAGTYYAFYYDAAIPCYSPASSAVTVSITACCTSGGAAPSVH